MSDQELAQFEEDVARLDRENLASPEKAREFLVKSGVLNEDGGLTEHYR
jgi:hypothetical protein